MTITFYRNRSDTNVVDKDISEAFTSSFVGILREESSVLAPVITLQASPDSFAICNYAYIAEFDRYYYIEDIAAIRNNVTQITMRVDVLMSYKTQIRASSALVKRNAYSYNLKLNDGSLATYADGYALSYPFSGGFNTTQFVLIVAGGG